MRNNRKNPGFFFIFMLLFFVFNMFFTDIASANIIWINFLPVIILFVILPYIIRNVKKPKDQDTYQQPNRNDVLRSRKETTECEYCGHSNEKGKEYCENCGAAQLPY